MSGLAELSSRAARFRLASSRSLLLAVLGLAAAGCPERSSSPPVESAPCREVGQRCEFAPGKLGSCVLNDNCKGPDCFVCQSQH